MGGGGGVQGPSEGAGVHGVHCAVVQVIAVEQGPVHVTWLCLVSPFVVAV